MKKLKKQILIITFALICIFQISNVSLAATQGPIECKDLSYDPKSDNKESKSDNKDKLEGFIITVLEEEIGTSTKGSITPEDGKVQSLRCFRQTICTEANGKTSCDSVYTENCTPNSKEGIYCQRVQVIISQSGVDLLMKYLGIIYRWGASTIGIVTVSYLIYGGFLITTAQDDTNKFDKAKEKIFQSIAGLVLLFLSALILYTINPNFFTL